MRTSIIKSGNGKSAVSSAAYQSASILHSNRLGKQFQYQNKEEVIYSQILLPPQAPVEWNDREIFWNAVEKSQNPNKQNSRYARQFIIALPVELSREECIKLATEFVQKSLVERGMCVDFAYHENVGNPHIHIMATCRKLDDNGNFMSMEKKVYALDEEGNKIPEIDSETGEQKVRTRIKNGKEYAERIWKRITVQTNEWNKREFLNQIKKEWADTCNKYLAPENKIDYRSYAESKVNRVPMLHEGPDARAALCRGIKYASVQENEYRRKLNLELEGMERFILEAKRFLEEIKNRLQRWREENEKRRCSRTNRTVDRNVESGRRVSGTYEGNPDRDRTGKFFRRMKENADALEEKTENARKRRRRR